jgi:hypothetical protein
MQTMNILPRIAAPKRIREDENTSLAIIGSFHLSKFSGRHYYQIGNVSPIVFELFTRKRV